MYSFVIQQLNQSRLVAITSPCYAARLSVQPDIQIQILRIDRCKRSACLRHLVKQTQVDDRMQLYTRSDRSSSQVSQKGRYSTHKNQHTSTPGTHCTNYRHRQSLFGSDGRVHELNDLGKTIQACNFDNILINRKSPDRLWLCRRHVLQSSIVSATCTESSARTLCHRADFIVR